MSARKKSATVKNVKPTDRRPLKPGDRAPTCLTVVTLGVSDLAQSRRFYCEGLGFAASSATNEHIVFIDAGGVDPYWTLDAEGRVLLPI